MGLIAVAAARGGVRWTDGHSAGTAGSLGELMGKRRYFGGPTGEGAVPVAAAEDADTPEDEIVVLSPVYTGADPWQSGPGPKTVVVSGSERRVVIEQG